MDQSVYGYPDMVALQHFHDFLQQIKQFSPERIEKQLECFDERFRALKQEFIQVYTMSCKSPVQTSKPPKKLDLLSQKYMTPMGKTACSVLGNVKVTSNVNKAQCDMNESVNGQNENVKSGAGSNDVTYNVKSKDEVAPNVKTTTKKRTAKAADISVVNEDSADECEEDKENVPSIKETTKVKKGSKKVVEEQGNNEEGTEIEETATSTKKKAAKTSKKKKKLKTGTKKGKKANEEENNNNEDQPDEQQEETETDDQKSKRRPSKKFKSSEEGENTEPKPDKKDKRKKLTKQKTITESAEQADKTLTGQRLSKHMLKSTLKTPSNIKRISLKILQSTIKKSTKPKRPLTRRAAAAEKAAAAAAKASTVTISSSTTSTTSSSSSTTVTRQTTAEVVAPSTSTETTTKASNIPQLIRPTFEVIRNTAKDAARIPATPQSTVKSTNNNFKFVKNTISKINKTFRSSIDKHKDRLSQSKPDVKKKSEKQVKAFLNVVGDKTATDNLVKTKPGSKEITSKITETISTTTVSTTKTSKSSSSEQNENDMVDATVIITDDESSSDNPKTPESSSIKTTYHLHKDRDLIEKSFKSRSPKCIVAKIPEHLLTNGQSNIPASQADKLMIDKDKRLTRELNQHTSILGTVQQPSRMLPTKTVSSSAIKATPSRPNYLQTGIPRPLVSSSTSNLMTPSKLTWTETEEKRKAELALKEAKDRERLADLEKQRQEKREELRKKREEKVKKVNDLKARQKEEQEAKAKEMEKKRVDELEKKNIQKGDLKTADETSKLEADRSKLVVTKKPLQQSINLPSSVLGSAQKKPNIVLNPISLNKMTELTKAKNLNEEFKKSLANIPKPVIPTITYEPAKTNATKNFAEQTYILDQSPKAKSNHHHNTQSYEVTPLQPPRLKDQENYDVSDLKSGDDTDDDEAPSKPLPDWAREPYLNKKAQIQSSQMVNFTKLFKSASKAEINLEQIFRIKRKKFVERSSSANWTTPPIWSGNGINGEESFMQLRNINE